MKKVSLLLTLGSTLLLMACAKSGSSPTPSSSSSTSCTTTYSYGQPTNNCYNANTNNWNQGYWNQAGYGGYAGGYGGGNPCSIYDTPYERFQPINMGNQWACASY